MLVWLFLGIFQSKAEKLLLHQVIITVAECTITLFHTLPTYPNDSPFEHRKHNAQLQHSAIHAMYMYVSLLRTPPRCSVEINVFELG